MRPVPFGNTQEAWFLRPNLPNRIHGSFMPAPTDFGKESYVQKLPETKPLVTAATKILLTVRNETFYSNKFKTPIYTYKLQKSDKLEKLFHLLAQTLMVDPKTFSHANSRPEGLNVFWHVDADQQGTKMVKLQGNKTCAEYGLDKNAVLYLKYRCRESKY